MEIGDPLFKVDLVLLPGRAVDTGGRMALQRVEAFPEQVNRDMVQQGGEPRTPIPACHLSHTLQGDPRIEPALSPGCGLRQHVPLSRPPSLHRLRGRVVPVIVRRLPRYYAVVRLPTGVHVGLEVNDLPRPTRPTIGGEC